MTDGLLSPVHNQNADDADLSLTPRMGFRIDAMRKIGVEVEGRRTKEVFQDLCNRIAELQDSMVDSPPVKHLSENEEGSTENISTVTRVRGRRKGRGGASRSSMVDDTPSVSPEPLRSENVDYDNCRTPEQVYDRRHSNYSEGEESPPDGARTPRFSFTVAERAVPGLVVDGKGTREVYEELCNTLQALQEKQRRQSASRREAAAMAEKPRPMDYCRSRGTASEGYSSCDEPFETPKSDLSGSNSGDEAKRGHLPYSRSRVESRDSDEFVSAGARVVDVDDSVQNQEYNSYEERGNRNAIPTSQSMDSLSLSNEELRNSDISLPLPKARSGATTPHHHGGKTPRPRSRYSDANKDRENEDIPLVSQSMDGALTGRSGLSTRSKPRPRSSVSRPDWDDNDNPDMPVSTSRTPALSDAEGDGDEDTMARPRPRPKSAAKTPRPKSSRGMQDESISLAPNSLSGRIVSDLNLSLTIPQSASEVVPMNGSMSERSPTTDDAAVTSPLTSRLTHRSSREFEAAEARRADDFNGALDRQVLKSDDEPGRALLAEQPSPACSGSPVLSGAGRSSPEASMYEDETTGGEFIVQEGAVNVAVAVDISVEKESPARASSDDEAKEGREPFAVEVAAGECSDSADEDPAKLPEDDTMQAAHTEDGPAPVPAPVAVSGGSEDGGSGEEDESGEDAKGNGRSDAGSSVAVGGDSLGDGAVSVPVAVGVAVAVEEEKESAGVEVFVSADGDDGPVAIAPMQRRRRERSPEPVAVAPPASRNNARGKARGKAGRPAAPAPAPARVKMDCRVLLLGLDNAGKTTMTRMIAEESLDDIAPTTAYTNKTITMNNVRLNLWDLAGQEAKRKYWADYYDGTDAILYVIDSADHRRTDEAVDHLHSVLDEEGLSGLPLLILSNKQDLVNAQAVDELSDMLMLYSLRGREWNMVGCSAKTGDGLLEAFEWLVDTLLASNDRDGYRDHVNDGWG